MTNSTATAMRFDSPRPVSSTPYLLGPVFDFAGPVGEGTRVLDVGCGNGFWAGQFLRRGCHVVGVDPSSTGIEVARRTYSGARFERIEAGTDLLRQIGEEPFDLVVSTEVIEHLYSPQRYAEGCFAALKPGGLLVLSTPYHGRLKDTVISAAGRMDFHHDALREGGHIKFFSWPVLRELLSDCGFADLQFTGAGRLPYLWKSMVVSARRPRA